MKGDKRLKERSILFEHDALEGGKVGLFTWDQLEFDDFTVTADSIAGQAVSPVASLAAAWGSIKVKGS